MVGESRFFLRFANGADAACLATQPGFKLRLKFGADFL
jgi:hypothetical protein